MLDTCLFYIAAQSTVAAEGDSCSKLAGQRGDSLRWVDTLPFEVEATNWTDEVYGKTWALVRTVPPWDNAASAAIVAVTRLAMGVRGFCGVWPERCAESLPAWIAGWCALLRRLRRAARFLPRHGLVKSALGISAAYALRQELPEALLAPLAGLACGQQPIPHAMLAVDNATLVFREYVGSALLLGEERWAYGEERVAKAQFHGAAAGAGMASQRLHRADVLLWILSAAGSAAGAGPADARVSPRLVELGVHSAWTSAILLSQHPGLQWLGVDSYLDFSAVNEGGAVREEVCTESGSCTRPGAAVLAKAREQLHPWLGTRAHLVVASTLKAAAWDGHSVDLLFVDANHTEEGAKADIAAWAPRVKAGGVVAGHDYSSQFRGVVEAAHTALPPGALLHLAPDAVYWWQLPS